MEGCRGDSGVRGGDREVVEGSGSDRCWKEWGWWWWSGGMVMDGYGWVVWRDHGVVREMMGKGWGDGGGTGEQGLLLVN